MISLFALRQKPYSTSESGTVTREFSDKEFTGRIDHRLSFVFASLFMLVLLVGGSSLYLLSAHLLKADAIAKQSEQIQIVEQIDRYLQHFTSEIQLAQLQGRTIPTSQINTSLQDLEALLTRYQNFGGAERNLQELRQIIAEAEGAAANFAGGITGFKRSRNVPAYRRNKNDSASFSLRHLAPELMSQYKRRAAVNVQKT